MDHMLSTVLQIHVCLRAVMLKGPFVRVIIVEGAMLAGTLMARISHINVEVGGNHQFSYACMYTYTLLSHPDPSKAIIFSLKCC